MVASSIAVDGRPAGRLILGARELQKPCDQIAPELACAAK